MMFNAKKIIDHLPDEVEKSIRITMRKIYCLLFFLIFLKMSVARTITTIGGNLCNTVSKRIIHLDPDGLINRMANWKLLDEEKETPEGNQSEFFAIIKLRQSQ